MKKYIIKRVLISFVVLFGVSILLYGIARAVPGDYVSNITAGNQNVTPEMEQRMRELYGLDKGIVEGYLSWLGDALHGDFGTSFIYQKPVVEVIKSYMAPTLALAGISMIFEILLAIPFGIIAARKQYSLTDYTIVAIAIMGISLPSFFFASVLRRVFSIGMGWLLISGMVIARMTY